MGTLFYSLYYHYSIFNLIGWNRYIYEPFVGVFVQIGSPTPQTNNNNRDAQLPVVDLLSCSECTFRFKKSLSKDQVGNGSA